MQEQGQGQGQGQMGRAGPAGRGSTPLGSWACAWTLELWRAVLVMRMVVAVKAPGRTRVGKKCKWRAGEKGLHSSLRAAAGIGGFLCLFRRLPFVVLVGCCVRRMAAGRAGQQHLNGAAGAQAALQQMNGMQVRTP